MAKRGRPKKKKDNMTYGLCRSAYAEKKDAMIMRKGKAANDYKFFTVDQVANSISELMIKGEKSFPIGIVLKDCSYNDSCVVDAYLSYLKINPVRFSLAIGKYIGEMFESDKREYNPKANNNKYNIGYHLYTYLDMVHYGNNLSIINQYITDIHYNLFKNHSACYILTAPDIIISPLYKLDIYISNFCTKKKSYLSQIMTNGIDTMSLKSKEISTRLFNYNTTNGKRPYHVNPFFEEPKYIPEEDINKKPDNIRYIDWYTKLYGSEFTMPKDINGTPFIKL
jgi:hypothetical protein